MIKFLLILFFIAHRSIACQSIEKLLPTPSHIHTFISCDENVLTINLAGRSLSSLEGFEKISEYIKNSKISQGRTIAVAMASNRLHTIQNEAFLSFVDQSPIEHLDLSGNKLEQLPHNFLSDVHQPFNITIKRVILRDNKLKHLPHRFLAGAPHLTLLDLSQNELNGNSCIPKYLFETKKPKLRYLIIAGRYQTPPRKGHKLPSSDQDLVLALSDSL